MAGKTRVDVIGDLLESWHGFQHAIHPGLSTSSRGGYLRSDPVTLAITPLTLYIFCIYVYTHITSHKIDDFAASAELRLYLQHELYAARYRGHETRPTDHQITFMQLVRATNIGLCLQIRLRANYNAINVPTLDFLGRYLCRLNDL